MAKPAVSVPVPAKYLLPVFKLPPAVQAVPLYSSEVTSSIFEGVLPPKPKADV
jgi:hypothetical protein